MNEWTHPRLLKWIALAALLLPAFIFWSWLMKEAVRTSEECPKNCTCYDGSLFIICFNVSLLDIPNDLRQKVHHLSLFEANATSLKKDHFDNANLLQITSLNVRMSGVVDIEPATFSRLGNLTLLHLTGNNISTLEVGTFYGLESLISLSLEKNKLRTLEHGLFQGLKNLTKLFLSSNELEDLDSEIFHGLSNVDFLSLKENKLTKLDPELFKYLPKLKTLNLGGNKGLAVPTDSHFLSVTSLQSLTITKCSIRDLTVSTFSRMPNLTQLYLSNNSLTTLDVEILKHLPNLTSVTLNLNPLNCNCELKVSRKWCKDHGIQSDYQHMIANCSTPQEVSGLWWGVLDNAVCTAGRVTFQGNYKTLTPEFDSDYPEYEMYANFTRYGETIIYLLLFLIGAIGNVTVIVIISLNKRMQTVPSAYILNLAVADLLTLVMNLPLAHVMRLSPYWELGEFLCKLTFFLRKMSIAISAFSVAMLSAQRYCVMCGSTLLSSRRDTICALSAVWFAAFLCGLPAMFTDHLEEFVYCSFSYDSGYYIMSLVFNFVAFCVIPLIIIIYMNVMTVRLVKQRGEDTSNEERINKTLVKVVIGLSIIFFISFVPYHLILIIISSINDYFDFSDHYIVFVTICLLVLNSCLNPVVLCVSSVTYRKLFKRYLLCYGVRAKLDDNDDEDLLIAEEAAVHYRTEGAAQS